MVKNIQLFHSSIRIWGTKVIYFDPYKIEGEPNDADIIFITHDHFDHFSPEDILKVANENTIIVAPQSMSDNQALIDVWDGRPHTDVSNVIFVGPNQGYENSQLGISFQAIPAYNTNKNYHPKENNWLGYVVVLDGITYYVAGDTDITEEAKSVKCDIALLPCGGTYTMDYIEAGELANIIKPKIAIPTHYGSVAGSKEDGEKFVGMLDEGIEGVVLM